MQETEQFLQMPYKLMAAKAYISPTSGKPEKLTMHVKIIYSLMKSRLEHFKSKSKKYYDSFEQIAKATGLTKITVGDIVRKLINNGIIIAHQELRDGCIQKWIFTEVRELTLPSDKKAPSKRAKELPPKQANSSKAEHPRSLAARPSKPTPIEDEEDDIPWP